MSKVQLATQSHGSKPIRYLTIAIPANLILIVLWSVANIYFASCNFHARINQLRIEQNVQVGLNMVEERYAITLSGDPDSDRSILSDLSDVPHRSLLGNTELEIRNLTAGAIPKMQVPIIVEVRTVQSEYFSSSQLQQLQIAFPNCYHWELGCVEISDETLRVFAEFPKHSLVITRNPPPSESDSQMFGKTLVFWEGSRMPREGATD